MRVWSLAVSDRLLNIQVVGHFSMELKSCSLLQADPQAKSRANTTFTTFFKQVSISGDAHQSRIPANLSQVVYFKVFPSSTNHVIYFFLMRSYIVFQLTQCPTDNCFTCHARPVCRRMTTPLATLMVTCLQVKWTGGLFRLVLGFEALQCLWFRQ